MKLSSIAECVVDDVEDVLDDDNIFNKQIVNTPENAMQVDSGERNVGDTLSPGGIPHKARHREYMGVDRPT